MTDNIHVSAPAPAPPAPAAPAPAVDPAAPTDPAPPPAPEKPLTPAEQAAADAEKAKLGRREELSLVAREAAAARRAKQALATERARAQQLEVQRAADVERAKAMEARDALWKNPSAALRELEKNGLTPKLLGQEIIEEGTPERQRAALLAEAERIAEEKVSKFKQEMTAAEQERQRVYVERQYIDMVHKNEDKYPALTALYTPRQLLDMTREVLTHPDVIHQKELYIRTQGKDGAVYTDEEIADFLEQQNKERYSRIVQRFGTSAAPASSNGSASIAAGSAAKTAPNVTNGTAAQPASKPIDIKKMSKAEQDAHWLAEYERHRKRT